MVRAAEGAARATGGNDGPDGAGADAFIARTSRLKSGALGAIGLSQIALAFVMMAYPAGQGVLFEVLIGILGFLSVAFGLARFLDRRPALVMDGEGLVARGYCKTVPWGAIIQVRAIGQIGSAVAVLQVKEPRRYVDLPDLFLFRLGRRFWIGAATFGGVRLTIPISGLDHAPDRIIEEIRTRASLPPPPPSR